MYSACAIAFSWSWIWPLYEELGGPPDDVVLSQYEERGRSGATHVRASGSTTAQSATAEAAAAATHQAHPPGQPGEVGLAQLVGLLLAGATGLLSSSQLG